MAATGSRCRPGADPGRGTVARLAGTRPLDLALPAVVGAAHRMYERLGLRIRDSPVYRLGSPSGDATVENRGRKPVPLP
ncbi:hypothetical protein Acsp01_91060 [Actinoplanes sp. NBRC 101535]|nr:hypothetical protein Acsp01_91060 [Actinoplanes sp. NBRC 101535]